MTTQQWMRLAGSFGESSIYFVELGWPRFAYWYARWAARRYFLAQPEAREIVGAQ